MARFKLTENRVVAITGAASGLGREMAVRFAAEGWAVHLIDLNAQGVQELAAELVAGGVKAFAHTLDITDFAACQHTVRSVLEVSGHLDVWVNNAGVLFTGAAWEVPWQQRQLMLRINAEGTMNGMLAALEYMRPAERGHIINTASLAALVGVPGEAVYAASKHAVIGLSTSVASDLKLAGHKNIHISNVCPDGMWTPMLFDKLEDPSAAMSFSGVLLKPEEVAKAVVKVAVKPKAVKTIPKRRGFIAILFSLMPSLVPVIAPMVMKQGLRAQKKLVKRAQAGDPLP